MPPRAFRNEKKNEFRDHLVDDDGAFFVKLNYFRSLDILKIFGGVWSFCRKLPKNHWLDSSRRRLKDVEKNEKGKRPQKKEPYFRVVCQTDVIKMIKMMIFRSNSPPPKKSLFCQKDGPDDFVKIKQNSKEKAADPKPNEALSSFLLFFWLVGTTKSPPFLRPL